jgi:hypothetical protein
MIGVNYRGIAQFNEADVSIKLHRLPVSKTLKRDDAPKWRGRSKCTEL